MFPSHIKFFFFLLSLKINKHILRLKNKKIVKVEGVYHLLINVSGGLNGWTWY